MESRQTKVAALLAELAANYVQQEANPNPLITITRADISKDYKNATIYFTTIPEKRQDDALIFLKRIGGDMRKYVMKHMRIKHIPHLDFMVDYGERHRQTIDKLVQKTGTESTFGEDTQTQ